MTVGSLGTSQQRDPWVLKRPRVTQSLSAPCGGGGCDQETRSSLLAPQLLRELQGLRQEGTSTLASWCTDRDRRTQAALSLQPQG